MKKAIIFFTLFFLSATQTKAQTKNMDLKTLEKITTMSSNEFEDWALSKGLTYLGIENSKYFDIISYKNGSKYHISFTTNKDGTSQGVVEYQTSSNLEYINLKKSCTVLGYKFKDSEYYEGDDGKRLFHNYYSTNRELTFYTSIKTKFYGYSIVLKNKNIRQQVLSLKK